jgi:hypothetical protein
MSAVARTARRVIAKGITGAHAAVYRATGGKIVGRMFDSPVLLLVTRLPTEARPGKFSKALEEKVREGQQNGPSSAPSVESLAHRTGAIYMLWC